MGAGFELTCSLTGEVDTVDSGLKLACSLTNGVDAADDGLELTVGVDVVDDRLELICPLTGDDGATDESFELMNVLGVGVGAIDGFFVAVNSEMSNAGAVGTLDGYKKKINQYRLSIAKRKSKERKSLNWKLGFTT